MINREYFSYYSLFLNDSRSADDFWFFNTEPFLHFFFVLFSSFHILLQINFDNTQIKLLSLRTIRVLIVFWNACSCLVGNWRYKSLWYQLLVQE